METVSVVRAGSTQLTESGGASVLDVAVLSLAALGRREEGKPRLAHGASGGAARCFACAGRKLCRCRWGGGSGPHLLCGTRVLQALVILLIRRLLDGLELALRALDDGRSVALPDHADGASCCWA